jgi:hypothetical protein
MSLVRVPAGLALILIANWEQLKPGDRDRVTFGDKPLSPDAYEPAALVPLSLAQAEGADGHRVGPSLFERLQNDFSDHECGWAGQFGATKGFRSFSVGDVVRLNAERWFRCSLSDWQRLSPDDAAKFEAAFGNALEASDSRVSAAPAAAASASIPRTLEAR